MLIAIPLIITRVQSGEFLKWQGIQIKPFQRLHGRSEYGGTGIDLAICDKMIVNYKKYITYKSALGEGATFIVSIREKPADLLNSTSIKNLFGN
jgi:light-regulated signal transduction histidine kinase (bacteriophytochrome)